MRCQLQQQKRLVCRLQQVLSHSAIENVPRDYETAFTICRKDNHLARGSAGAGGPTAVSLDIGCPTGYKPIGISHTHPRGNTNPSAADEAEMKKLRLEHLCILVPQTGEMHCHRVR